jgi:hypothetical protein
MNRAPTARETGEISGLHWDSVTSDHVNSSVIIFVTVEMAIRYDSESDITSKLSLLSCSAMPRAYKTA